MGFLERVHERDAAAGIFSDRSLTQPYGLLTGVLPGGMGIPPTRGTADYLRAYAQMPWLRATTSRIAMAVAQADWQLFITRKPGARAVRMQAIQRASRPNRVRLLKQAAAAGELVQLTDHPLLDLLHNANSFQTGFTMRKVTQVHLDLVGDAFWLKERDASGTIVGVWPIPPHWIMATPTPAFRNFRVSFRAWRGLIPDTEWVWFQDVDPLNPYGRGTGIAQAISDELETDEYAARTCHDDQTECLTRRGWVPGLDLLDTDEIATWNHQIGALEWQRPLQITRARYVGEMHYWNGDSVDACLTPTHRLWVLSKTSKRSYKRKRGVCVWPRAVPHWHFEESREAATRPGRPFFWRDAGYYKGQQTVVHIPPVARVTKRKPGSRGGGRPPKFGVDEALTFTAVEFAAFLGYYMSEGSHDRRGLQLCQAEGRYVDDIRRSLSILKSDWVTEKCVAPPRMHPQWLPKYVWMVRHHGLAEWIARHVGHGAHYKRIPAEVFEWVPEAQREFLRTLVNGDGSWSHNGGAARYWSMSLGLVDDLQRLCVQLGYSSRRVVGKRGAVHSLSIRCSTNLRRLIGRPSKGQQPSRARGGNAWMDRAPYDGVVWCVTVPNERFFSRRHGCVMLGGNTKSFFYNRAKPDLLIWPKNQGVLRGAEVARLEQDWINHNQGFWRAFRPYFLTREVDVKELDLSFRQLTLVPLREFERNVIMQQYGMPPEILGVLENSNRACYSDDTECLTRRGWVSQAALTLRDEIATWNEGRNRLEYHRPRRIVRYPYTGPMHHWQTSRVDVKVTPDHRMWVKTQFRGPFHLRRSCELADVKLQMQWRATGRYTSGTAQRVTVPYVANDHCRGHGYENEGPGFTCYDFAVEVFAEFLGYWISEGSADKQKSYKLHVHQNVGVKADKMQAALRALNVGEPGVWVNKRKRKTACVRLTVGNKSLWHWMRVHAGFGARHKRLPREVYHWPMRAQMMLLDAMMLGDGSSPLKRTKSSAKFADRSYSTVSKGLADDIQQLCVQLGLRSRIRYVEGMYVIGISSKQQVYVPSGPPVSPRDGRGAHAGSALTIEPYSGIVWCVEVPNHVFFTRRHGQVALHGNTIDAASYLMAYGIVEPRLEFLRTVMQERLVPEFDERLILEYVSPVREDVAQQLEAAKAAPWALTVDEWRHLAGAGPLGDETAGQLHMVPFTVTPTDLSGGAGPTAPTGVGVAAPNPTRRQLPTYDGDIEAAVDAGDVALGEQLRKAVSLDVEGLPRPSAVAARQEPALVRDLVRVWQAYLASVSLRRLEDALGPSGVGGDVLALLDLDGLARQQTGVLEPAIGRSLLRGIALGAEPLRSVGLRVRSGGSSADTKQTLDVDLAGLNVEAAAWAREHAAALVMARAEVQRQVRRLVQRSIDEGIAPADLARLIRAVVGLTDRQVDAVANFRARLADQGGVTAAQLERRVDRYAEAQHRLRATNIARTELVSALNHGQQLTWQAAVSQGAIQREQFRKQWLVVDDERLEETCFPARTKVLTMHGWVRISQISVGDFVLTHQDRFRVVTATNAKWYEGRVIRLRFARGIKATATYGHRILTSRGWVSVEDVTVNDDVAVSAIPCARCGESAPVGPYRKLTVCAGCANKYRNEKQARLSNMMRGNTKASRGISSIERPVARWLNQQGIAYIPQWPFTYHDGRGERQGFADFYLPGPRVVVECDGWFHYRDTETIRRDQCRTANLAVAGIRVLRFNGQTISRRFPEVATSIREHCCLAWLKPLRLTQGTMRHQPVYDLTVAEDHSFLAGGIAAHNCEALADVKVEIGEEFPGGYLHPPAHPSCRCAMGLVGAR